MSRTLAVVAVLALAVACSFRPEPVPEAEWRADQEAAAARGRVIVEQAVSAAPERVYTINYGNMRAVGKNFVLEQNRFCYDELATRGRAYWDDYWTNYDRYTDGVKRSCSYYFVKSIKPGDDRD
jgi:hypothetical protein